jgi:hypothetical protein
LTARNKVWGFEKVGEAVAIAYRPAFSASLYWQTEIEQHAADKIWDGENKLCIQICVNEKVCTAVIEYWYCSCRKHHKCWCLVDCNDTLNAASVSCVLFAIFALL